MVGGGGGGVHGEADRGELGELGQIVEDGVEDHRHQEVAARVLLSVIITSSININIWRILQKFSKGILCFTTLTAGWNIAVNANLFTL